MKPYYNCRFAQKKNMPLDGQTFQEAIRFPLSWRTHMEEVVAHAYDYDCGHDCLSCVRIDISLSRDSFVNRRGDFAWHEFHALLEKLENQLDGYGFKVDWELSRWDTDCVKPPLPAWHDPRGFYFEVRRGG